MFPATLLTSSDISELAKKENPKTVTLTLRSSLPLLGGSGNATTFRWVVGLKSIREGAT